MGIFEPDQTLPSLALRQSQFVKASNAACCLTRTGNGTISILAGTYVAVAGIVVPFLVDTAVTMPSLTAGTDYAVYVCTDGTIRADASFSAPTGYTTANSRQIGGFHYQGGGNATAQAGGNTTAQINPSSLWDLTWRPVCPDPRGMTKDNNVWVDIYALGVNHHTDGTSKSGATIADNSSPPKIPASRGGNGTSTYATFNWLAASEIFATFGKRLLTYAEFMSMAYGVTEAAARGSDPVTTGYGTSNAGSSNTDEKFTSYCGVVQASGCFWTMGADLNYVIGGVDYATGIGLAYANIVGGRGNMYRQGTIGQVGPLFGGDHSAGASAGSRCSNWSSSLSSGGATFAARGCAGHLRI